MREKKGRLRAAAALGLLLLLMIVPEAVRRNLAESAGEMNESAAGVNSPGAFASEAAGSTGGEKDSRDEETEAEESVVDAEEAQLLATLWEAFAGKDLAAAAAILDENQEALKALVGETLFGEKYIYYEEREQEAVSRRLEELAKAPAGRGLVITRYNTVFFGEFADGRPNGDCLAIQAMVLDAPRYTYAEGSWKDGRMNGNGTTGYRYYETVPEGSYAMAEKQGSYEDNLLDGEFVYTVETADGVRVHWNMAASQGITVLDDRWSGSELGREYVLRSEEDPTRSYVLTEEKKTQVMWNNLILWDE